MTDTCDGLLSTLNGWMAIQSGFFVPVSTNIEIGRFAGRIEHVPSHEATRFHSLGEMLAFIARVLAEVRDSEQQ
jgi:hypothetical protein